MVQPFFPELNNPQAGGRTNVPIATISANQILFSAFGLMLATALFSMYGVIDRDWRKRAAPWVLAMALIALVHGLIIVTRLVMHAMRTALLWCSSYYCHFFVIYVLLICVVITSSQLASDSVWRRFCADCLSLALLAVALNSASITHQLCVSCARQCRPVIEGSAQIDAFIKSQLAEGAPRGFVAPRQTRMTWVYVTLVRSSICIRGTMSSRKTRPPISCPTVMTASL